MEFKLDLKTNFLVNTDSLIIERVLNESSYPLLLKIYGFMLAILSRMNLIKNDLRSRLLLETLNDLMSVSYHGPEDIHEFDSLPAITRWKS